MGVWASPDKLIYHYQWQVCNPACTNITTNATKSTYKLTSASVGADFTVVVTATDVEGQTGTATANAVGPVADPPPPSNRTLPTISGAATDGQTLTAHMGAWASPDKVTYGYQWQVCNPACTNITTNGTKSTYKLTSASVGADFTVVVTATDVEAQTGTATANPVGPVST